MYRRTGARFDRGRIAATAAAAAAATTPATILGAKCTEYWRSDLGITIGTGVSAWAGQVLGLNFSQGTAGAQPTYNATGGPNSRPSVLLDGVDDHMDCDALVRTQPQTIILIARQVSWQINDSFINDANTALTIFQRSTSPNLAQSSGAVANPSPALPVGTYKRIQGEFQNTIADRLLIGAIPVSGASAGPNNGTRPLLGRNSAGSTFCNEEVCEVILANDIPSPAEDAALNAYFTDLYGATVVS